MDYLLNISAALSQGAVVTLKLFFITIITSMPLGLVLALARMSSYKPLSTIVAGFIWLMRGTPLLLQLLFIAYGLPNLPYVGITLDRFPVAIVAFGLNYAAYLAEIFRGGINSVDRGQYESAKVLGMNYLQTFQRIVLPQMFKNILPPLSNEIITLVKDTSLIYILTLHDILQVAKGMVSRDFDNTPFLVAGLFYLLMTFVLTKIFYRLETYYARYDNK